MGFRAAFLKHEGNLACHNEVVLFVLNRIVVDAPTRLLMIGVDNGGSLQVWRDLLPEGSEIVAVDERPECHDLNEDVHVGRVSDRLWLESALGSNKFDLIIDSMGHADGSVWPWLQVGGIMAIEHYDDQRIRELMTAIVDDKYTWLPYEEVMGVQYYPHIVLIEKRNPRAVPYIDILIGSGDPVVPEDYYLERGAKRVQVAKEMLENL